MNNNFYNNNETYNINVSTKCYLLQSIIKYIKKKEKLGKRNDISIDFYKYIRN